MTTQMVPDLVEICLDLETKREKKPDLNAGKQSRQTILWALMGSGIGLGTHNASGGLGFLFQFVHTLLYTR